MEITPAIHFTPPQDRVTPKSFVFGLFLSQTHAIAYRIMKPSILFPMKNVLASLTVLLGICGFKSSALGQG